MQNKCNSGCHQTEPVRQTGPAGQGFVPVNGNWDFNMNGDCGCQPNARRNRCDDCGQTHSRARQADCRCERCDDSRGVDVCRQNTHLCNLEAEGCSDCSRNCSGKEDCRCERCAGRQRGETDCARRRNNTCDADQCAAQSRSRKNRTVGMINVEMQEIDEIYQSESALRAGTLFPELHKPLNGYCPYDGNCGTCKQAAAFAAWEMRLYLNTHPRDKEALALFSKLCKEAAEENYATTFLTDECCANGWSWVNNPWPWEYDCRCGDDGSCGDECRCRD